jgi:FkbM family methyltransferase
MPVLSAPALDRVAALRGAGARPLHVLDVGANPIEGEVSYRGLLDAGHARVTGFEPQPEAFARLAALKGPHETYLPDAVGDGSPVTLRLTKTGGFASVFEPDARAAALLGWGRGMRVVERLHVPTVRLDDLDLGGPVDFLKIDVQGAELGIIAHGRAALSQAIAVQTEVRFLPIYAGEPRFGALDGELHAQGFAFHDFLHLKRVPYAGPRAARLRRRAARQVVDGDAVYLRDLTGAGAWGDDALLRLAILALGVFASPAVAVHCLDILAARGRCTDAEVEAVIDALPEALRAEVVA